LTAARPTAALLLLAASGLAVGCGLFHHAPPEPPPILILQPPLIFPAPPPAPMPLPYLLAPELGPLPPLADAPAYAPPPREAPRRPAPPPRQPAAAPPLTSPPLTAGLSPQQQARLRRDAARTLGEAGAVLAGLNGRRLSPSAAATRAQADEYVRQGRQALASGDVVRAQTLADKAITLARFLAGQ
jgi:hypothetical protein